jgi:hypothetical protein
MITNDGKEIIAKYLLGQAPAYGTHIALGCGPKPGSTGDFSEKKALDFEMVRVPIISNGFVNDLDDDGNTVTKMAYVAEMPQSDRLQITEIGLWSAASNANAQSDSRMLYAFDIEEPWAVHTADSVIEFGDPDSGLQYFEPIDLGDGTGNINISDPIFSLVSDNAIFANPNREDRQEGARYLDNTIVARGDAATINDDWTVSPDSSHVHLNQFVDLSANNLADEISFALCVSPKSSSNTQDIAQKVRLLVEWTADENTPETNFARMEVELTDADFNDSAYIVVKRRLDELVYSPNFSWSQVRVVRIWSSVYQNAADTTPTGDQYLLYDAIRFDNISTPNPLYVLTGYAVANTADGMPVDKVANTSNYVEFRVTLGIQ